MGLQVPCSAWKEDGSTVFSGDCDMQAKMWPILSGGQAVTVGMHDAPIKNLRPVLFLFVFYMSPLLDWF